MEEEVVPKGAIPAVVGSVAVQDGDSQTVKDVITKKVEMSEEMKGMSLETLEKLKATIDDKRSNPVRDTSIRAYAGVLPQMVALEVRFLNSQPTC